MKNKLIYIIMIVITIVGAIIIATKGFEFCINYRKTEMLEIYLGKEFEINDIRNITNGMLPGKEVKISKIGEFENTVAIIADEITEEEKNSLIEKINEKYELENKSEEVISLKLAHTRLRDIVKPYILPTIISSLIILIYFIIVYRRVGVLNIVLKSILNIILPQATIIAIIAISRLKVAEYTMPVLVIIYSALILIYSYKLNQKLDKIKQESNKK